MFEKIYDLPMTSGVSLPFELPQWISVAPFEEFLGMEIVHAGAGQATLRMPFKAALCQGKGLMHGGAIVSLADTSLAMAIKSLLPEGTDFVTMNLELEFHAAITSGTVRAEARVVNRDDRNIEGVTEIYDGNGIKAATFKAVFRIRRPR